MNIFEWDESIPVTANNLNEMQNILNNNVTDGFQSNGTILWTNPNPTADFAEQTITLSSSDYDVLEWYFRSDVATNLTFCQKSIKGTGTQILYPSQASGSRQWSRRVYISNNTQFLIGAGKKVDGTTSTDENSMCVPLYVIGYKTGLFE